MAPAKPTARTPIEVFSMINIPFMYPMSMRLRLLARKPTMAGLWCAVKRPLITNACAESLLFSAMAVVASARAQIG
jgi:hypothetical protein